MYEVHFDEGAEALQHRRLLEEHFRVVLIPVLERVFDAQDDGRLLQIDRLEVDLGSIRASQLSPGGSPSRVTSRLEKRLAELIATASRGEPIAAGLKTALLSLLERGKWPNLSLVCRVQDLEDEILGLPTAQGHEILTGVRTLLGQAAVRRRLAGSQFSGQFFDWIVDGVQPAHAAEIKKAAKAQIRFSDNTMYRNLVLNVAALLPSSSGPGEISRITSREVSRMRRGEGNERRDPGSTSILEHMIYVSHAGIILVHPFLEQFFSARGLLNEERQFSSTTAQSKAVHLLHYLATGVAITQEPDAVLFKLLCGLPLPVPLDMEVSLSEEDLREAEHLLESVIGHWRKLRNTSPAGLRGAFIERDGKLVQTEKGWNLIVEQKAIDLLLDALPWSLSPIRLPWLDCEIRTDWT